jgi:hypothetical protein
MITLFWGIYVKLMSDECTLKLSGSELAAVAEFCDDCDEPEPSRNTRERFD